MFGTEVVLDENKTADLAEVFTYYSGVKEKDSILCIEHSKSEKIIYRYGGEVTVLDPSDNILRYCKNVLEISNLDSEEEKTLKQKYLNAVKDSEEYAREIEEDCKEWADFGDIGCTF